MRLFHRSKEAYKDTCGPVSEVVTARQPAGSPLYIVFTKPEYEIEREPILRGPSGPFTFFDSNGYIVPVFSSANVVNYEGEVFTYSPAGEVAIGNVFGVTPEARSTRGTGPSRRSTSFPRPSHRSRCSASCSGRRLSNLPTSAREISGLGATAMLMQMAALRFRSVCE